MLVASDVVDWQEGRSYRFEVVAGTMPLDDFVTELAVEPVGEGSVLQMTLRYRRRWGLFAQLVEPVLLRSAIRRAMHKVVDGLAAKAAAPALLRAA